MKAFKYLKVSNENELNTIVSGHNNLQYLAGGTNIVDLMKEHVEIPDYLVDINSLPYKNIHLLSAGIRAGGLSIGALNSNAETANHGLVRKKYPLLSKAILAGASSQIRNMATNGGNLLQRTRCSYFYDVQMPCNKRKPGSGCGAINGLNRMHAIFGWSKECIAVFPSDMAVALSALDAVIVIRSTNGILRYLPVGDFHRLPEQLPNKDNNLGHGELIVAIEIPENKYFLNFDYLKVRDRASYAFALVSVAAALDLEDNQIQSARIALGGVAARPWRAHNAENFLIGKGTDENVFLEAGSLAVQEAKPFKHNKFKVELCARSIANALLNASSKPS